MRLLALDSATEACSAALWLDGELHERFEVAPRGHARLLLPMIDGLLAEAGLALGAIDALAFGRGPGAFTGLRIATAAVQGIAFAAGLPVVPVSDLAALAQGAWQRGGHRRLLAAIDARMDEVYWGAFEVDAAAGRVQALGGESVCPPGEAPLPAGEGWFGAGSGWGAYAETLQARVGAALVGSAPEALPRAGEIALLGVAGFAAGEAVEAAQALPVYLRDQVAWKKAKSG